LRKLQLPWIGEIAIVLDTGQQEQQVTCVRVHLRHEYRIIIAPCFRATISNVFSHLPLQSGLNIMVVEARHSGNPIRHRQAPFCRRGVVGLINAIWSFARTSDHAGHTEATRGHPWGCVGPFAIAKGRTKDAGLAATKKPIRGAPPLSPCEKSKEAYPTAGELIGSSSRPSDLSASLLAAHQGDGASMAAAHEERRVQRNANGRKRNIKGKRKESVGDSVAEYHIFFVN
jgi:hypothetical protein